MSLDEAVALALQNDAQRQADILEAEARRADGWQAVAGYGPSLSVSGSYMRSRDSSNPGNSAGIEKKTVNFEESEITVVLSQPLVDLERANAAMQGMEEMKISALMKKGADEDLILKVHERYYSFLAGKENLRLAEAESRTLLEQVQYVEEKLELGFGTITDQYDARARYQLSVAAVIARRTEQENARKALEELLLQPVEVHEDVGLDGQLPLLPVEKMGWVEIALSNNTDFLLTKCSLANARFHYRAVLSRFLPRLSAFADYSSSDSDDGLLGYGEESSEFEAGLRLEMDIWAGGADSAAAVAASRRVQEARKLVVASERSLRRSVSSLEESIHDTALLIGSYRQAVDAGRRAMEATREAYLEGVKQLLDVLNAQQDYYRALGQYRTTRYDYMVLLERFRQVVGVHDFKYENE